MVRADTSDIDQPGQDGSALGAVRSYPFGAIDRGPEIAGQPRAGLHTDFLMTEKTAMKAMASRRAAIVWIRVHYSHSVV